MKQAARRDCPLLPAGTIARRLAAVYAGAESLETLKPDFSRDCRANTSRSVLRTRPAGRRRLPHDRGVADVVGLSTIDPHAARGLTVVQSAVLLRDAVGVHRNRLAIDRNRNEPGGATELAVFHLSILFWLK